MYLISFILAIAIIIFRDQLGIDYCSFYIITSYKAFRSWAFNKIKSFIREQYKDEFCIIERHAGYLYIEYTEDHRKKSVYIPLRAEQSFMSMQCEVTAIYDNSIGKTIKQDTDIPLMVTAQDLGAKKVQILNVFNGTERIYKGNQKLEYFI